VIDRSGNGCGDDQGRINIGSPGHQSRQEPAERSASTILNHLLRSREAYNFFTVVGRALRDLWKLTSEVPFNTAFMPQT